MNQGVVKKISKVFFSFFPILLIFAIGNLYFRVKEFQVTRFISFIAYAKGINLNSFLIFLKTPLVQIPRLYRYLKFSQSQLSQDLFVISYLNFLKGGYFVEFGASDGIFLSNTYVLENHFHWTGILAEPGQIWHKKLMENRPNAQIDKNLVWSQSDETLLFYQNRSPEFSGLNFAQVDSREANILGKARSYPVTTISLNDLLQKHNAPHHIDFLSIDTEGTEYDILSSLDFDKWVFSIICVEHNYSKTRDLILHLLKKNGYCRIYEDISCWDDWYVKVSE